MARFDASSYRLPSLRLGLGALLAGACLILAPAAHADEEDELPPTSQFFDEYDRNMDGQVVMEEFDGGGEAFRLLDRNRDGAIKPDELGLPADFRPDPNRRKRIENTQAGGMEGRGNSRIRRYLRRLDKDDDERVSRAEWPGEDAFFDRLDRNGDGYLDAKDAQAGGSRNRAPTTDSGAGQARELPTRLKRFDLNGNGKVERAEWQGPAELFDRFDRNGDGVIEVSELGRRRGGRAERDKPAETTPGGNDNARQGPRLNKGRLRRFDRDGDGQVTADEFPGSEERFKSFDTNGDGVLDAKDLEAKPKPEDDATPTTPTRTTLSELDKDGNGKLDRTEFTGTNEAWKRLDVNGDGWVTEEELGE